MRTDAVSRSAPEAPLVRVAFAVILCAAGVLSMLGFHFLRRGISFHGRDFGFFVAQYRHLLDSPSYARLPMNPNGNDVFGFEGIDGYPTVHDELHFSPIKYLLSPLYLATGSLYAVEVVFVAAYLLALGYFFVRLDELRQAPLLRLGSLAILALTPTYLFATTFDLRPFMLIGPAELALVVALYSRAPSWHLWGIAALGLIAREDILLVLAIGAVFLHLDRRERDARVLYGASLAYLVLFAVVYVLFRPFRHEWTWECRAAMGVQLLYPALVLAPAPLVERARNVFGSHRALAVLGLGAPFFGMALRQIVSDGMPGHLFTWSARWYAPTAILVMVIALLVATRASSRVKTAAGVVALALATLGSIGSVRQLAVWRSSVAPYETLWALLDRIPPETPVLTDYVLYQAVSDRDHVLVWDRFPAFVLPSPERDHPRTEAILRTSVFAQDGLVVMSHESYDNLLYVMGSVGDTHRWTRCAEGERWIVLRPSEGARVCPPLPPP